MSGLAVFSLKIPSLLQFDRQVRGGEDPIQARNLRSLFGMGKAPSDTRMRERLDEVDHRDLRQVQKSEGLKRRLVLLEATGSPLLLHDEPIWEGGRIVGLTTSGAVCARTGKHLALGLIEVGTGETLSQTTQRTFRIQVGRSFYHEIVQRAPVYDPAGVKLRGQTLS